MIEMMTLPLLACFVLAGIHVYLGFHVLERGVIFLDIALAQVAALGFVVAFAMGIPFHTLPSYLVGAGTTLAAATLLAFTRGRSNAVNQEALIGVVYVVAASAAILVMAFSPKEAEHLKHMLVGNLLFVTWPTFFKVLGLYGAIGLLHFAFRRKFWAVSRDPSGARKAGLRVRAWDFLFYASFGLVVTSSVEIAGVLLVFAFLIMPAFTTTLLSSNPRGRLFIGWALSSGTSALALALSYRWDTPTGATVVCALGALTAVGGVIRLFANLVKRGSNRA